MGLFKEPIEKLSQLILELLKEMASKILSHHIFARNILRGLLEETMHSLLDENLNKFAEIIKDKIEAEKSYLNYAHEDFDCLRQDILGNISYYNDNLSTLKERCNFDQRQKNRYVSEKNQAENYYIFDTDIFQYGKCQSQIQDSINAAKHAAAQEEEKRNARRQRKPDQYSKKDDWEVREKMSLADNLQDHEIDNIIKMKRVIYIYFQILKKNFKADIPKYVVMYLVERTIKEMSARMHNAVRKFDNNMHLVSENEEIAKKRRTVKENIQKLEKAKLAIRKLKSNRLRLSHFEENSDGSETNSDADTNADGEERIQT